MSIYELRSDLTNKPWKSRNPTRNVKSRPILNWHVQTYSDLPYVLIEGGIWRQDTGTAIRGVDCVRRGSEVDHCHQSNVETGPSRKQEHQAGGDENEEAVAMGEVETTGGWKTRFHA